MTKELNNDEVKHWYMSSFRAFEGHLNGGRDLQFHDLRREALARFSDLGFPTQRDENWKYTNLSAILRQRFAPQPAADVSADVDISSFTFDSAHENLVVFLNGRYNANLSSLKLPKGVVLENIGAALTNRPELIEQYLGRFAEFAGESFTALNTAFTDDGTFLFIPENTVVTDVIHVLHLTDSGSGPFISYPRSLFVVGKNSSVEIIESYHSLAEGSYFNNAVVEVVVGENATVEHTKIQEENTNAFHISNTQVHQERDSKFTSVNVDLGGGLVRNNLNVLLNNSNCESHLFGFYMGSGKQHIDNQTFIDHAKPNCFSNELYKGILDNQARGVFNGKILVRQDAQKTNALQSNKTLLLTDEASVNAKPQLEIFADDVKCTHGATIGQLDDEALFYLRARGISAEMAGAMLRHAFIADVLENIANEAVRERLDQRIIERFTN